jgi:hypothetical protein
MASRRGVQVSIAVAGAVFVAALVALGGGGAPGESQLVSSNVKSVHLGGSTSAIAWGQGALWATAGDRLARIDPSDMAVKKSARISSLCDNSQLAVGLGSVWITSGDCGLPGRLVRVDPKTMEVVGIADAPGFLKGVAVWHGRVWVTVPQGGRPMFELDPAAGQLNPAPLQVGTQVSTGPFAPRMNSLLATSNRLWGVVGGSGSGLLAMNEVHGALEATGVGGHQPPVIASLARTGQIVWAAFGLTVVPLDANSGRQIGPTLRPGAEPLAMAGGSTEVWIATPHVLYRGSIRKPVLVRSARLPFRAEELAVGGNYLWAAGAGDEIARLGDPPVVS